MVKQHIDTPPRPHTTEYVGLGSACSRCGGDWGADGCKCNSSASINYSLVMWFVSGVCVGSFATMIALGG